MRTLAVDALRLVGNRTAMGRYIEYLIHHWSELPVPFDRIVFFTPADVTERDFGLIESRKIQIQPIGRSWPLLAWEQALLPWAARGCSILFCPSYTGPLAFKGPVVVANHGIYERIPDGVSWWRRIRSVPLFRLSARRADRVIANSQSTAADVSRFFGIPASKIDVVYPAAGEVFFQTRHPSDIDRTARELIGEEAPYLLFVGKMSKRRNVPNLLAAFASLRRKREMPHHLLIVGPNTTRIPISEMVADLGVEGFVHHVEHLDHDRLAMLYAGAEVFVLPTSYEGISWTMFEAMASGAPVLTVAHPTVDEGCKDAVLTVPSASVDDLTRGLERLLSDGALREHYRRAGRERAGQFSWREAAASTMEILDKVALEKDRRASP